MKMYCVPSQQYSLDLTPYLRSFPRQSNLGFEMTKLTISQGLSTKRKLYQPEVFFTKGNSSGENSRTVTTTTTHLRLFLSESVQSFLIKYSI